VARSKARRQQPREPSARSLARAYRTFRFADSPPPPLFEEQSEAAASSFDPASAVHEFDWRRQIALAPPSHQGLCNTCTSFAIAAAIEAHWQIAHPQNPISISAGYTHTCLGHGGSADAATVCKFGIDIRPALGLLQAHGIARRHDGDYPFPAALCPTTGVVKRLRRFARVTDVQMARNEIASRGPIVADMYFWADFFDYSTARAPVYVPDTSLDGPDLHSVCVVGFNNAGWIVKNSFGASWGDGTGYAVIAHGQCALLGAPAPPGFNSRHAYAIDVETATT
jgi:hypothetical protein